MEKTLLRPALLDDLPTLYQFEQGIISAERPFDPTLRSGHINYYDLKELIERSDAEVIVAEINGHVVASGYVKIVTAKPFLKFTEYAYIGFMYVDPNNRRQGLSHKIINQLVAWAKSKNLTEVRLDVYDQNNAAVSAYQKIGFTANLVEMRMEI